MRFMRSFISLLFALCFSATAHAAKPIELKYNRAELEAHWKSRIQSLLDQGKLPKIDMETSLQEQQAAEHVPGVFATMDELGVALLAADGYQAPKDGKTKGYRWSYYIRSLVNQYPDRFIPTANGGTNPNWLQEKGGKKKHFIDQMEKHVHAGVYANMGELDFRHYMSSSQCQKGRTDRDNNIALNGENGHRLFQLAHETGVPFFIHLEPEDAPLNALEKMLGQYPKARVVVAHFGQIRHPEVQTRFTPDYARKLFSTYLNLYYDLAAGYPNRKYKCAGPSNDGKLIGDTVLWEGGEGNQSDALKAEWRAVLTDFSDRFVFASDYGGGHKSFDAFLRDKVANFERITRDLPDGAKHDMAYKNAWKLLTGSEWN
jgi:predicted TIM-barrel fold metal-dependent hydrolase